MEDLLVAVDAAQKVLGSLTFEVVCGGVGVQAKELGSLSGSGGGDRCTVPRNSALGSQRSPVLGSSWADLPAAARLNIFDVIIESRPFSIPSTMAQNPQVLHCRP